MSQHQPTEPSAPTLPRGLTDDHHVAQPPRAAILPQGPQPQGPQPRGPPPARARQPPAVPPWQRRLKACGRAAGSRRHGSRQPRGEGSRRGPGPGPAPSRGTGRGWAGAGAMAAPGRRRGEAAPRARASVSVLC